MALRKKMVIATVTAGAVLLGSAATAWGVLATDTGDHFSNAAGTIEKASLKTGTSMVFNGSINGIPITVTCTGFSASGKIPATGLTVTLSTPPTFSGCSDSLGGTDTVTTNSTNGKWKLQENDSTTETGTEPNRGDHATLIVPKAGATFSSSLVSGCVVTVAPTAAAKVKGTYNDVSTIQVKNATIPLSGSGCTATSTKATATVVLSPSVHDTN